MFRCPTCIALLPDPAARRCQTCRQRLRRRRPRVLGEEHRIGAKLLPIDRALNERLRTTSLTFASPPSSGLRNRWHSGAPAAIPPPPVADEPPAPHAEASTTSALEAAIANATRTTAAPELLWGELERFEAAPEYATVEARAHRESPAEPVYEPMRIGPGPLDPEVQALVDDLYRRAREEIAGTLDGARPDGGPPDEAPAPASESQPTRRRGWVPAVLADRKRSDSDGNGNANGADH